MITIRYSCDGCGIRDQQLQVPAREHEGVDVVHWVQEIVGRCISDDHRKVSPNCKATAMKDLMIPLEGSEFIGQQVE